MTVEATEQRTYSTLLQLRETQAVGAGRYRYLEGRAVPYDVWADLGLFMERHAPRSFAKSTKEAGKNLPLLMFHDRAAFPIGRAETWAHEDDGLRGVWRLSDSADAQRAAREAADGGLSLSVGFQPIRSQITQQAQTWAPDLGPDHKDWLTREESRLVEVSLTPTPAYVGAEVTMVRSAFDPAARAAVPVETPALDAWRADLDRLRSTQH